MRKYIKNINSMTYFFYKSLPLYSFNSIILFSNNQLQNLKFFYYQKKLLKSKYEILCNIFLVIHSYICQLMCVILCTDSCINLCDL